MNKLQGYIGQHRKYSQYFIITIHGVWASQMALVAKNSHANARDVRDASSIPGSRRSHGGGHANPLQYSCLENPKDRQSLAGYSRWGHKNSDMTEVS